VPPPDDELDPLLLRALAEDRGRGDVTAETLFAPGMRARGRLIAKAEGVLCGLRPFERVFELIEAAVRSERSARDGDAVRAGQELVRLDGGARTLVTGERTALNVLQRLSGVATLTRAFVERARGAATIYDTRKTTPGMRRLEKYAVRCGGGQNHRLGLDDQAMIKNNHLDVAGEDLASLVRALRARHGAELVIHAEARDEKEALAAIEGGADVVLLDNFDAAGLRALCPRLRAAAARCGRTVALEASGGVTLDNVGKIAASGVDRVSVGALTHSAPALDLSFRMEAVA
jgi:nicotinate-nucleotide pyrophosphorylase (carboxylating)